MYYTNWKYCFQLITWPIFLQFDSLATIPQFSIQHLALKTTFRLLNDITKPSDLAVMIMHLLLMRSVFWGGWSLESFSKIEASLIRFCSSLSRSHGKQRILLRHLKEFTFLVSCLEYQDLLFCLECQKKQLKIFVLSTLRTSHRLWRGDYWQGPTVQA